MESSREINTDAMLSYIYGFICHYALDHACHTYVEQKIMASGVPHTEIEVEFDRMLMLEDGLVSQITGNAGLEIGVMVVIFVVGGALFVQSESCGKKSDTAAVQAGLETL